MPNASVFGFPAASSLWAESQPFQLEFVDDLPDLPALPETLLQMELKLHEFSVDLRDISQLVLSDLGATLQILRLAARESGPPARIEDCIADLGLEACLQAAGRRTVLSEARHRGVIELWAHSREVAQLCRRMAATTDGRIDPEQACLVGLTHALGMLPGILSWQWPENRAGNWVDKGVRLAQLWSLPLRVQESFAEMQRLDGQGPWTTLLRKAHARSRVSPRCPMCEVSGPQLCPRA